jgi:hypothetical protein
MHRFLRPILLLALAVAIACSNDSLGTPDQVSVIDTVTLGAIEGTPISVPSGYNISIGAIRTDQVDFEFAYNVRKLADGTYQRVFLPRAALGLASTNSADPGLIRRDQTFDEITRAPSNGYTADSAVPVQLGERYVVRSRVVCTIGVPYYGKLEILSFQDSTVTFKVLTDLNCGFKDLVPGLPKN